MVSHLRFPAAPTLPTHASSVESQPQSALATCTFHPCNALPDLFFSLFFSCFQLQSARSIHWLHASCDCTHHFSNHHIDVFLVASVVCLYCSPKCVEACCKSEIARSSRPLHQHQPATQNKRTRHTTPLTHTHTHNIHARGTQQQIHSNTHAERL